MNLHLDFCVFLLTSTILFTGAAIAVETRIQTDGTLSGIAELNINAPGANHLYTLSEINGKLSGHNLFYSFSDFSIGTTDTAWFNLSTSDLANVISRVTGGAESIIDGQFKMTNVGSAPSFFFINPAGITFNPGASVDVPGSFYVSTASHLKFSDGSQYAANETNASSLSSVNPESFGFLGDETGSISLGNSSIVPTELTFQPGSNIAFVGNQVQINNTSIMSTAILNNDLTSAGLNIQLIATGVEAVNIRWDVLPNHATAGDLTILDSILIASGNGTGRLAIRSADFVATDSTLSAANLGAVPMSSRQGIDVNAKNFFVEDALLASQVFGAGGGGEVKVVVEDSLKLRGGGQIFAGTFSQGRSGDVLVSAGKMEIDGLGLVGVATIIGSQVREGGANNAGNVTVEVRDSLRLVNGGQISASTFAQGKAGNINISAGQMEINGGGLSDVVTSIASQAHEGSTHDAGQINVTVTDTLKLLGGGSINSGTFLSQGNAGEIRVTARNLEIDGQGFVSGISSQAEFGIGNAGLIIVDVAESLRLFGGGQISSSTFSQGRASEVHVTAQELKIDGQGLSNVATGIASQATPKSTKDAGQVTVLVSDTIELLRGGQISSDTFARGDAGDVSVSAKQIMIDGSGYLGDAVTGISSSAQPGSSGHAGKVYVTVADTLKLLDGGQISSSALRYSGGDAGEVEVTAGELIIDGHGLSENNTGVFSAAARDSFGNAGRVSVTVGDMLRMLGEGEIGSSTFSVGKAGEVAVSAGRMEINDSTISSGALFGQNRGVGNVKITATNGDIQLSNHAFITTLNLAFIGDPKELGDVEINLTNGSLYLDSSQINTESTIGHGGKIDINAKEVISLFNSSVTTSVYGPTGNGGDINLASSFLILDTGFIKANTSAANASGGDINIQVPTIIPSGNSLFVGDNTSFEFQPFSGLNIIQAVAPDGVNGTINATTPQLNLNAMMTNLMIESFDANALNRDMCSISDSSSLMQSGKGAQPLRARDLLLSPLF